MRSARKIQYLVKFVKKIQFVKSPEI